MMRMISYHINARSRMTPETVKALMCLQDWIRATANTRRPVDSVHDIILALEGEETVEASS